MSPSRVLLSLTFIALSVVDASPPDDGIGKTTLSLTRHINVNERGITRVADKDRARAQAMKQAGKLGKRSGSISATNALTYYSAQVGIGTPATTYTLLIDSGSSNTFVGADKAYTQTSSSHDTGNSASMSYGSGSWSGEEWIDTVTLSSDLVIDNQSIGVANTSSGFNGVDGILGVGPVDLTQGTVSNTNTVPTVMDNLVSQGTISTEVLGVYFVPSSAGDSTGTLTFGDYDSSDITGPVNYVPLTTTSPASRYWGIDQSTTYGSETILSSTAGIVDTGTTLILIATDAFQQYKNATGGVMDSTTGLLSITSDQYQNLQSLCFNIGGVSYELTPNGQIWPRSLNYVIGGNPDSIYLVVSDIGSDSGSGLDFLLGYSFLERYYSIYDTTHAQMGFARTSYTTSTSN